MRDIASGLFVFILLVGATPQLLGWFMLAATGIPVGDALIVLRNNGPQGDRLRHPRSHRRGHARDQRAPARRVAVRNGLAVRSAGTSCPKCRRSSASSCAGSESGRPRVSGNSYTSATAARHTSPAPGHATRRP
ncbi:DUF4267 domain-containing protein [Streptomyces sp. NPDC006274]|uniref:DUF4267 domain-containing protein n=1 Tax=unclassified Streptomyces TaxID=2593676 RepID=UPI0033BF035E